MIERLEIWIEKVLNFLELPMIILAILAGLAAVFIVFFVPAQKDEVKTVPNVKLCQHPTVPSIRMAC